MRRRANCGSVGILRALGQNCEKIGRTHFKGVTTRSTDKCAATARYALEAKVVSSPTVSCKCAKYEARVESVFACVCARSTQTTRADTYTILWVLQVEEACASKRGKAALRTDSKPRITRSAKCGGVHTARGVLMTLECATFRRKQSTSSMR